MMKPKILIIEDDKNISKLLKYNLEKSGFDTVLASSGEDGLDLLSRQRPDLIILDLMLPQMDGLEVCRSIRQNSKFKNVPIIMLTAKGEEVDRIVGLELGADDYMVKPFSPREIILRIRAVLRRMQHKEETGSFYRAGMLMVDIPRHRVMVHHKEVELTPLEFKLLAKLLERRGLVQSREKLLNDVWELDAEVFTRTVDTHIKHLRSKLGEAGKMIETVIGMGYRFREDEGED